jgi:curli biogenesis system outer membrane secretion channel CsgG
MALALSALLAVHCTTTKAVAQQSGTATTSTDQITPQPHLRHALTAPKKRIAVAKFDAVGSFTAQYGTWDIGGGLASQLTSALVDSGRFIVVERADLAAVLHEQEMSAQKIVSKETTTQVGHLLGAQLLVYGAVTEFDQSSGGEGLRLGVGRGFFGGSVGGQIVHGSIGIELRLIDTSTGEVIQSHRVEQKVSQKGVTADINVREVTFGGDKFEKTPLGQATRQAIEQAVAFIVQTTDSMPWRGRVVEVNGDQVYINAGSSVGLEQGDIFAVSRVARELTDPDSGAVLKTEEVTLGEVEVMVVEEKISIARMRRPFVTQRGDLVKYVGQR